MNHFELDGGELHCEGVALSAIADAVGTPTYVYSTATLERHYTVFRDAFAPREVLVAYSVKASGNLSILKTLAALGAGADTVSEGEIRRALAAGIPPERIVFSGVGKTVAELAFALEHGVGEINVESEPELDRLAELARAMGRRATIAIRVNPDVGAGGHAKIATGKAEDKFGVSFQEAARLYAKAVADPALWPVGLACHIGSQITDLAPMREAFGKMRGLVDELRGRGLPVQRLDLGGGLGAPYFDQGAHPPLPADYAEMVKEVVRGLDIELAFEPGRVIVANAAALIARVVHVHARPEGRRFLVLDAGMNDLVRPAMYDAYHDIRPVNPRPGEPVAYDVVGPVCETGDTFARARLLPPMEAGDLVAFMSAGAYGASMSSEYNARPLAAEVLVKGDRYAVIRRRPTYDEMMAREPLAEWL
ncbi:MAG: diaminopimelate decarboxylase [Caulobacteraceae bacterium]